MSDRPLLDVHAATPAVRQAQIAFHADIVAEVATAVARDPVVLVGMAQNPVVKKARKLLDGAGVKYTYLEYGSYFSQWKQRLAIKMWSGWPTFPQIYVKGTLIGGAADLEPVLAAGELAGWIEASPPRA